MVVPEPMGVVYFLFMFLSVLQENSVYVNCETIRLCFASLYSISPVEKELLQTVSVHAQALVQQLQISVDQF